VNLQKTGPTAEQPYFVPGYQFGSIGQILPGLAVRITDPDDDNVRLTLNEQGMIWFKGPNVFKGYIGREDLNEGIFRDGWFKTGDLGKVDLNGILTLGGRRSRFSKVAGEMVPHEVVENAIEDFVPHPEGFTGRAVAVVGVPDPQKGEALVLLSCVHHSNLVQALDEIRTHMVEQGLPRLWCPREIIPVEVIPALPTGKMDLRGCQMLANEALGLQ
jgi:acyl-[acyl-carrier-protein]-phospholipid O-acyltransferase/long-chain-fatty-acid--[acyl-carrier-protein] ligase